MLKHFILKYRFSLAFIGFILFTLNWVFNRLYIHIYKLPIFSKNINKSSSNLYWKKNFFVAIASITDNVEQIINVKKIILIFKNQILDLYKFILLYKTFKEAKIAIADEII